MSPQSDVSKGYKKHITLMALSCALVLSLIASINLAVDPANLLLDGDNERAIAQTLTDGLHVQGSSDLDGVALQRHRITLMPTPPHTAVIGSSRAMQIRNGFTDGPLVNNAVSSGALQQACIILGAYMDGVKLPAQVLFVADPWLFNAGAQNANNTLLPEGCERFASKGMAKADTNLRTPQPLLALEFISYGYLQASLTHLRYQGESAISPYWRRLSTRFIATAELPLNAGGWLSDGSFLYPAKDRAIAGEALRHMAQGYASQNPVYNLGHYREISPLYRATFGRILDALAAKNVNVVIVLPPYHPAAAQALIANPAYGPIISQAEEHLRAMANERNLPIYGGYFTSPCGEDEFYDAMHPRQSCMAKILGVHVPAAYSKINNP